MILRWQQGRDTVDDLLARGRLTQVTPNRDLADTLLTQARAHLTSATTVVDADPAGAFTLVYDAAHAVLLDVVIAQLDPPLGTAFRPFTWMRPLRNHTQYPAPEHPTAQIDDVHEALPAAAGMIDAAAKLLDQMPAY